MTTAAAHTRRVLSDMSVNTPIKSNTPAKLASTKGLDIEGTTMSHHAQLMNQVAAELKGKRHEERESPSKRRKIAHDQEEDARRRGDEVQEQESPPSSFENSALDESQNTIITVPDDERVFASFTNLESVAVPVVPLTAAQIRAKAISARLRLTLASYKVRTNQIDVPISRLEIRSSTNTPTLPQLRRTVSNTSQRRTALPSAPSSSFSGHQSYQARTSFSATPRKSFEHPPSMALSQFQELAQRAVAEGQGIGSSPPRLERERDDEMYSTPILPRQRAGLLNPPLLERDESGDAELTSSVVKGRAADGLLSLGRMGRDE